MKTLLAMFGILVVIGFVFALVNNAVHFAIGC